MKPVKRIHVPSKDALARQMAKIVVDYKLAFTPELNDWLRPYAAYFGRVANGSKPECAWHAAARQMADDILGRNK